MAKPSATKAELRNIDSLVSHFNESRPLVSRFLEQLRATLAEPSPLTPHIHSMKWRLKDPDHLRDKLIRKLNEAKAKHEKVDITTDNLLVRITDLAGIRILHLYTGQFEAINKALREILNEQRYKVTEGPFARTWDDESREFFKGLGIETEESQSMYTSVHYIVGSYSRTKVTCEIQVRTLMEEVWGEVEHQINYPQKADSVACREQLMVLARVTSSATRLVDSIFRSHEDHKRIKTLLQGGKLRPVSGAKGKK